LTDVIDAHVHLWSRATDPQDWVDPVTMAAIDRDFVAADLTAMLAETRVGRAVVVQSSNSAGETTRLLQLAAANDEISGVVGWVDMTRDVREQLDSVPEQLRRKLVGVRHLVHIDPDEEWLDRDDVHRGFDALAEAHLTFDLVVRWWQLERSARTVERHPDLTFVLDHLGGVPDVVDDLPKWEDGLRAVAAQANASSKLSGVSALMAGTTGVDLSRVVGAAFDAFGARRLMYGSDWPLSELGAGVGRWRHHVLDALAGAAPADRAAVLGGTATRLYTLDTP
jgi:L-fuconolactonase